MEEREQLRRQIRLLQGLINDHKNVHGDVPVPAPTQVPRWRNPRPPGFGNQGVFSTRFSQPAQREFLPRQSNVNTWRKKYSLVNVPPRPALCPGSSISANVPQTALQRTSSEISERQPAHSGRSTGFISKGNAAVGGQRGSGLSHPLEPGLWQNSSGSEGSVAAASGCSRSTAWPSKVVAKESKDLCASASPHLPSCRTVGKRKSDALATCRKWAADQAAPKHVPDLCRTISESAVALKTEPRQQPLTLPACDSGGPPARKKPSLQAAALCSRQQVTTGTSKSNPSRVADSSVVASNLTWEASSMARLTLSKERHAAPAVQTASGLAVSVKSPRFKKTDYTWVANPSKPARPVKRGAAAKASENTDGFVVGAERGPKGLPKVDLGAKQKKGGLLPKLGVSSSRYKWKASSLQATPSTSASAFSWRRKECGGAGGPSAGASTSHQTARRLPLGVGHSRSGAATVGFFSYKLKSRTKIIRRKGSACSPVDRRSMAFPTVLLKSRYCLRKRNCPRGRSLPTARRGGSKGLVQIGRNRLHRLPASRGPQVAKEGSGFLATKPTARKVVNTRYRIVKKMVASPLASAASFNSPALGWKARRLAASRSLVLNRTRHSPPGNRSQALAHPWKNKGLRCIGGVLYRVSANKLAKTSSPLLRSNDGASRSHARIGRLDPAPSTPGYSPSACPGRSATSRYIASRAVQRSLAIIRQAKQKKEKKKEYCMYYNRFGKCNRGEHCPYIHDPEKVAVCTRFLRGTCKKTDGTCPFSHKVSKDKMPVCSYFLKGICNNSDCPYSHVYVSRKAEVCPDFLKGYCPLGEKCKKKHTLVCPDFLKHGVCPKGPKCKLQHPQKKPVARRSSTKDTFRCEDPAPKQGQPRETSLRKEEAGGAPGPSGRVWSPKAPPQSSSLAKLPSFISLKSPPTSPGEEDPKPERDRTGEDTGRPLQIKPRL